jgi:hypothetical protein
MTLTSVNSFGVAPFHSPGFRVELRALKGGSAPHAVIYDHHELDALLQEAQRLNADGFACYHTINPLNPGLTNNASDRDVVRLHWLPYDIDPTRPKGAAATDAEKAAALNVADKVVEFWQARGVQPALVDSGNGFYVLVPIDLPVEDKGYVDAILRAHSEQFNTPAAKIDVTSGNPSRILRIPGTLNAKGENTPDRPHRVSTIINAGSRAQLADLNALGIEASKPLPMGNKHQQFEERVAAMRANIEHLGVNYAEQASTDYAGGVDFVVD